MIRTRDKNNRIITEGKEVIFDNGTIYRVKKNNGLLGIASMVDHRFHPFINAYPTRYITDARVL